MQYIFRAPKPGSVITIIPIKPIDTASHLQNPTFSLKKKIEKVDLLKKSISLNALNEQIDQNKTFINFKDKIALEAITKGISKDTVKEFKTHAKFVPRVIELDKSQPEFKLTLDQYLKKVVTPLRIKIANKKYQQNKIQIKEISKFYGVQPRFLIALWGIETDFGRLTGGFSVISSFFFNVFFIV